MKSVLELKKTKNCSKVKNHGAGPNLFHSKKSKINCGTNFLAFFLCFFPVGKMNAVPGHSPASRAVTL